MTETIRPNAAQMAAPSYRMAAMDQDFLLGDSMRGVRFLMEYAKAEEALRAWGVRSTLVVFGSARIREGHRWYEQARAFGRLASERGGAFRGAVGEPRDNVIATGGGPGIMEAANRGAVDAGAPSVGFNITISSLKHLMTGPLLSRVKENALVDTIIRRLRVKTPNARAAR